MSRPGFALHMTPKPSRRFRLAMVALHGLAVLVIATLPWLFVPKAILIAIILFSLWQKIVKAEPVIVALTLGVRGGGSVVTKVGAGETAATLLNTVIYPGMIVLRIRIAERTVTLVLLPDSLSADESRRLRVWLRTHRTINVAV